MESSNKRKPLLAANWKMNGSKAMAAEWLEKVRSESVQLPEVELAVLPPFPYLDIAERFLTGSPVSWGAQNMNLHHAGAYTGEVAVSMLKDFHCHYVLIGHSERRLLFKENDTDVAHKYSMAIQAGLHPIICIGETLEERNANITHQIISCQLGAIFALPEGIPFLAQSVIAYEPVWAIGTGLAAHPEQVQEIHYLIRSQIAAYDTQVAEQVRILYGGSVKKDNAETLLKLPDVDGALIGGASLQANEFLEIAKLCNH